jgi:predicted transcriptional regulator
MDLFWENGPMFLNDLREFYDEPKPHFNTLSTQVRTLEAEGLIGHKTYGNTHQYFALVTSEEYNKSSLANVISKYFDNSYLSAVSALVKEERISVEELKELIKQIEKGE